MEPARTRSLCRYGALVLQAFAAACSNSSITYLPPAHTGTLDILLGTLAPPGSPDYWNGICGTFRVQPATLDEQSQKVTTQGAPFEVVESAEEAEDGGSHLELTCTPTEPGIVHGIALVTSNFIDCSSGASLDAYLTFNPWVPGPDESEDPFVPANCIEHQTTPLDARVEADLENGIAEITVSTNVPPGDADHPHGICATFSAQAWNLDTHGNSVPYTQAEQQLDSANPELPSFALTMNEALLVQAGVAAQTESAPPPNVWRTGCVASTFGQDNNVLVTTGSDFVDCASGAPIAALAGRQIAQTTRFDCEPGSGGGGGGYPSSTFVSVVMDLGFPPASQLPIGYAELDLAFTGAPIVPADSSLCIDYSFQPFAIDASGARTAMGAPLATGPVFAESPYDSGLVSELSFLCIASLPAPAADWSVALTATSFTDCYSGAAVADVASPQTLNFDFNCGASSADPLTGTIDLEPASP